MDKNLNMTAQPKMYKLLHHVHKNLNTITSWGPFLSTTLVCVIKNGYNSETCLAYLCTTAKWCLVVYSIKTVTITKFVLFCLKANTTMLLFICTRIDTLK